MFGRRTNSLYTNPAHRLRGIPFLSWIIALGILALRSYLMPEAIDAHPDDARLLFTPWHPWVRAALWIAFAVSTYMLSLRYVLLSPPARRLALYVQPLLLLCLPGSLAQTACLLLSILMVSTLFDLYQNPQGALPAFHNGLMLGIAVLLSPSVIYSLVTIPFLLYLLRCLSWRNLGAWFVGLITVPFLVLPPLIVLSPLDMGSMWMQYFVESVLPDWFWLHFPWQGPWWHYAPALPILLYLISISALRANYLDDKLSTRVRMTALSLLAFFFLLLSVISGRSYNAYFMLITLSVSLLSGLMLSHLRGRALPVALLFITAAAVFFGIGPIFS